MDLRRKFIDTPFSTYVYDGGYLGLAPDTNLERVFVRLEGTMGIPWFLKNPTNVKHCATKK
jgi:hypothetical protein